MKFLRGLQRVVFVLFAGSLWAMALIVAPLLFHAQSDRHLAGLLAARLFSIETYLALGAALLALLTPARAKYFLGYAAAALLVVNEWALKPLLEQARLHGRALGLAFGPWHGVSALIYVLACLMVLLLVWKDDFR